VVKTSTLVAKKGAFAKLDEESIKVDTNLDVDTFNIRVRVVDMPQHGLVKVKKKKKGERE
jgi:hypothetical protein